MRAPCTNPSPGYYSVDISNIRYAYSDEEIMIYMCHHDVGYRAGSGIEQGFINVASQLDSLIDEPPSVGLAEEQVDEHILGLL